MSTVGDLGRRVAERRRELGLTQDEVATRAGMSSTFVHILESSPSPQLSRAALWRLAAALDTSVDAITGSGMEASPGRGRPPVQPHLEALSIAECRGLLRPGGVGRVVFSIGPGPVAFPVNFRMLGDHVVFRTEPDASLLSALADQAISFEVDHLDEALTEGWSVLFTGEARKVVDAAELERAQSLGIAPWAGGQRDTYVVLVPHEVTGRRIRQQSGHG